MKLKRCNKCKWLIKDVATEQPAASSESNRLKLVNTFLLTWHNNNNNNNELQKCSQCGTYNLSLLFAETLSKCRVHLVPMKNNNSKKKLCQTVRMHVVNDEEKRFLEAMDNVVGPNGHRLFRNQLIQQADAPVYWISI